MTFATAVPDPMAMPMFAFFRAGASLTPSPVIATFKEKKKRRNEVYWQVLIRLQLCIKRGGKKVALQQKKKILIQGQRRETIKGETRKYKLEKEKNITMRNFITISRKYPSVMSY